MTEARDNEVLNPSGFGVRIFLTEHSVTDLRHFGEIEDELREQMQQGFGRHMHNVYWHEDASGFDAKNKWMSDIGFRRYGSFRKAAAYTALRISTGREPSDQEIDDLGNNAVNSLVARRDTDGLHDWMQLELLDGFIDQGYSIEILNERPPVGLYPLRTDSLPNFISAYKTMAWTSQKRDEAIAQQLVDLSKTENADNTRVVMVIGANHRHLLKHLPPEVLASVEVVQGKMRRELDPRYEGMESKLFSGHELSDEEWEAAYEGYKRSVEIAKELRQIT